MFFLGFLCAWIALAALALVCDCHSHTGIHLWDGWGATLLTLPAWIVLYPVEIIIKVVRERHEKNS